MRRCGSVLRTVSAILRLLCVCVAALASRLQVATSASTTFLQAHAHGCAFFVCKWPLLLAQGWSYVYTRANPFVFVFFFVCGGPKQEPEEMECIFLSATTGFTKGFIENP